MSSSEDLTISNCQEQLNSIHLYENTRKINIFVTIAIITIGLIGNCLAVFVFIQKKFRVHSSSVYLLCLCFFDGLFLSMHFFEDTLRTYIDVYLNDHKYSISSECSNYYLIKNSTSKPTITSYTNQKKSLLITLNITDRFDLACRMVNYFRYLLRFISAYIIVAFTIQRMFAIHWPFFQAKFDTKKYAWAIVFILLSIGVIMSLWVPFLFELIQDTQNPSIKYCDISKEYSNSYFLLTIFYIVLTMLIPIIVIFTCNTLIIISVLKAGKKREKLANFNITHKNNLPMEQNSSTVSISYTPSDKERKYYFKTFKSQVVINNKNSYTVSFKGHKNTVVSRRAESNRITRMLLLMSFSYAFLNLPYFISWCLFYYKMGIKKNYDLVTKYYLFSAINLCEIFYVLNYGVHFFIYCASGNKFRQQLKNALSL